MAGAITVVTSAFAAARHTLSSVTYAVVIALSVANTAFEITGAMAFGTIATTVASRAVLCLAGYSFPAQSVAVAAVTAAVAYMAPDIAFAVAVETIVLASTMA